MKKQKIIFRKTNSKLRPEHLNIYFEMLGTIKEDEVVQAEYSSVKRSKTHEQLKYIFGAVYPHLLYWHRELWGTVLYNRQIRHWKIPVTATVDSIDEFMKELFAISKGEEFKKRYSSIEVMTEYIEFLNNYSVENFGEPIPEAKYGEENNAK